MSLYSLTYDYLITYIFTDSKLALTESTIMNQTFTMNEWLAHTATIVIMALLIILMIHMVIWIFKQVSNTFTGIGR